VLLMVTKDVFVVIESLVKNQCKGRPCNFLPFSPLPPIFSQIFIFFHLRACNKFVVLSILIGVGKILL
jgi:hypothetical protein